MGISVKELEEQEGQVIEIPVPKKKKGKTPRTDAKNGGEAKAKKAIDVEVFVKEKPDEGQEQQK